MIYITKFSIVFFLFLIHSCSSACIPSSKQCGCSLVKPLLSQSKIVGGYTARDHSWPWIVSLRQSRINAPSTDPGSSFCGGTLVSNKYVVTAAHCFYSVKLSQLPNYFAVVGAQYRNDTNPVRFTIKSVTIHNKYNETTYENDIALLELAYEVDFNDFKNGFICLPPSNIVTYPNESMNGIAIGWGLLEQDGTPSNTLQQVQLPVLSNTNQYCLNVLEDASVQFCAGFIQGGKDTCQGDSGGPLMIYNSSSDTWNIAGITSYGYGCALPEYPGVYTRVSMFVNWINAHIAGEYPVSKAPIKTIANGFLLFLFCINIFF